MGCDGGTIPKRDELVRTKKKPEQKDRTSELAFRWAHCALTQQPLASPIVACEMGRLYNKESVIEGLLDTSTEAEENSLREVAPHVRSLRDVKELKLTENPDWEETGRGEIGDGYIDVQKSRWICPVSGMEMNGRFRFCFLWSCGCVLAEKALKEMMKLKEEGNECPKCNKHFTILDIITLNPSEDKDILTLQEKKKLRKIVAQEAKDAKKKDKKHKLGEPSSTAVKEEETPSTSGASTSSPSKIMDKVKKEEPAEKKSKIVNLPSKKPVAAASATSRYSIAKDPKASEVYKSLFTSHASEANQTRAHWITYNPFYN